MRSDSRGQTSTHRSLGVMLMAVAGVSAVVFVGGGFDPSGQPPDAIGERVCDDAFGEGWEYRGYMAADPPTVQCSGPDGLDGTTEMPPEMQRAVGVVTDETYRNMTEDSA